MGYGYGSFGVERDGKWRNMNAHRVAWELICGPVPDDLEVCHNCPGGDNPACVNPAHMFIGTHAENMHDRDRKGRVVTPFILGHHKSPSGDDHYLRLHPEKKVRLQGEGNPMARFTENDVREIRRLWATGEYKQCEIARMFGTLDSVIYGIRTRKKWKHVRDEPELLIEMKELIAV